MTAGERRYLTAMFCDLVDSSGSARRDAEEWCDLVGPYLDAASAVVTEAGGHVAKKLGDSLMSIFGYPVAHENDAKRAVRAALSIQRALAELNRKNESTGNPALAARVAIESGSVVASDFCVSCHPRYSRRGSFHPSRRSRPSRSKIPGDKIAA